MADPLVDPLVEPGVLPLAVEPDAPLLLVSVEPLAPPDAPVDPDAPALVEPPAFTPPLASLGALLIDPLLEPLGGVLTDPPAEPLVPVEPPVPGDAAGLEARACASRLQASKSAWVGLAARATLHAVNRLAAATSAPVDLAALMV